MVIRQLRKTEIRILQVRFLQKATSADVFLPGFEIEQLQKERCVFNADVTNDRPFDSGDRALGHVSLNAPVLSPS